MYDIDLECYREPAAIKDMHSCSLVDPVALVTTTSRGVKVIRTEITLMRILPSWV